VETLNPPGRWAGGMKFCCQNSGIDSAGLVLPVATINTWLWNAANGTNQELQEEIGWPEMVDTVAAINAGLPPSE
jgi:hypothetical protein